MAESPRQYSQEKMLEIAGFGLRNVRKWLDRPLAEPGEGSG